MQVPAWVYRYRGALVSPPLVLALFWPGSEAVAGRIVWPLGTAVVLLGVAVRVWAQQHLRHRLQMPLELTTTGPFSLVRNPLYSGSALISMGATIVSEVLWLVPITFLWCLGVYTLVAHYEETRLLEHYGEPYRNYLAEVPRWLPRTLRLRSAGLVTEYFWRAVAIELRSLLLLVPYIVKSLAPSWFRL